jgi:DNA-binding transcriptional ArsR family regulator
MPASDPADPGPEVIEALAAAMSDPVRFAIALSISEAPGLTIREIAARVDQPHRRVRYQLGALREAGLVEVSSQGTRRGAIENRYSLTRRLHLDGEGYDSLPAGLKTRIALEIFRQIAGEVEGAAAAGTLGTRPGSAEIRTVGTVDQAGWDRLAELSLEYLEKSSQVFEEAGRRVEAGEIDGIRAAIGLFLLERGGLAEQNPP